ncbi:MAG: ABC transporter ATP-binding protein [Verrucomicrobia bacterium]|nr:ABC transporter ATP-binding protein [Verrucomicrobiota bacterium]
MQASENSHPVLETEEILKSFPNGREVIHVLQGVNFKLLQGQTVSIQGESGSGKTTFLNIISGLESLDSGRLLWNGNEIGRQSTASVAAQRARQLGFIFQAYYLLPELNVLDNVILSARLLHVPGIKDKERARRLLDRVGLKDRMHFSVEKLSGGERQRVAIARALMNKPNLILADEPTGNLDEQTGDSVIELLLGIAREEGTSLILVTHNSSHAVKTDARYRLHLGKLEQVIDES